MALYVNGPLDSEAVEALKHAGSLFGTTYIGSPNAEADSWLRSSPDPHTFHLQRALSAETFLAEVQETHQGAVDYLLWLTPEFDLGLYAPLTPKLVCGDGYRVRHYFKDGYIVWRTMFLGTEKRWRLDAATGEPYCCDPDADTNIGYLDQIIAVCRLSAEAVRLRIAQRIKDLTQRDPSIFEPGDEFDLGFQFHRLGDADSAGGWFRRRAQNLAGDDTERGLALYYYTDLLRQRGASWADLQDRYHQAFELAPTRVEALLPIIRHYRTAGQIDKAHALARVAFDIPLPKDRWPIERRTAQLDVGYELMKCAAAVGDHIEAVEAANYAIDKATQTPETAPDLFETRRFSLRRLQPEYPVAVQHLNTIKVIVPFRNAGGFLRRCVESLDRQDYANFHVYLIDDASTDGCADRLNLDERFTLIRNGIRREALYNQHHVLMNYCKTDDIAFFLDGDDWLAADDALSHVNDVFNRTGCWVMYGQCMSPDEAMVYAVPLIPDGDIYSSMRRSKLKFPLHPRCHRAGLFHRIADQDPDFQCLRDVDGEFYKPSSDFAHMRAMFHLAGVERVRYSDRVIYTYNRDNPNLTGHTQRPEQLEACNRIAENRKLKTIHDYRPRETARKPSQTKTKLLVCTLEGVDAELLRTWLEAGELPFLRDLSTTGAAIPLQVEPGFFSTDSFLTSAATGLKPHHHENLWAERLIPNQYGLNSADHPQPLSALPYWDALSRQGLRVASLNPFALPLTNARNVTQLQNWGIHVPWGEVTSHPAELAADVLERFGDEHVNVGSDRARPLTEDEHVALRNRLVERVDSKLSAYKHYLDRKDWDVYHVFFDEGHDAGHQMWHVHDPTHPRHPTDWMDRHGDPLLAVYKRLDQALAEMYEHAGAPDTFVVVGSGMGLATSCSDQLPEMLSRIETNDTGSAAPPSMHDCAAFTLPGNKQLGAVRINLTGREPLGRIEPGAEFEAYCDRIASGLESFVDIASGERIVERVVKVRAIKPLGVADSLPDLIVVWRRIPQPTRVESPRYGALDIVRDPHSMLSYRSGDHNGNAALITNLPTAGSRYPNPMPLEAVAPTICWRFGVELPQADEPAVEFGGRASGDDAAHTVHASGATSEAVKRAPLRSS